MGRLSRALAVAVAVLALVALPGCGAVRSVISLQNALENAGYRDPRIRLQTTNSVVTVAVTWRPRASGAEGVQEESHGIATVVWRKAAFHFDAVETLAIGLGVPGLADRMRYEYAELAQELGDRPESLEKDLVDAGDVRTTAIGAVVALLVVVLGIVLVVVLVLRRGRKRRAAAPAGWPPGAWPQQGQPGAWPQQGPPRPGPPDAPGGWPPPPSAPPPPPPPVPGDPGDPWRTP